MKVTLELDDCLLKDIHELAIDTGRTFTQVIEDALRLALANRTDDGSRKLTTLHTCGGNGLQAKVELSSNSQLSELMEE
jgi:hypothetical protein